MDRPTTSPLAESMLATCGQCGAAIWDYGTPSGKHVALDDAPGPYIIDGSTAYETASDFGFRAHWDHCRLAASLLTGQVGEDDFLWI